MKRKSADGMQMRRKAEREEKKRREDVEKIKAQGYEILPRGVNFSFVSPSDRRGTYISLGRRATLKDVVTALFPIDAFNTFDLPVDYEYKTFLTFLGFHMLISVENKKEGVNDVLKSTYADMVGRLRTELGNKDLWGVNKYEAARREFLVSREQMRGIFSNCLARLINFGEFVILDEKQRTFTGHSPTIRKNNSKPEPIGHMMTQLSVVLHEAAVPFVFGFFPYDKDKFLPDTSHSGKEVAEWVVDKVRRGKLFRDMPVVVADSLYNTYDARDVYLEKKFKFIMSVKPSWWGGIAGFFDGALKEQGDTRYAWNKSKKIVVCHHWDRKDALGKKYVVSNAFIRDDKTKFQPGVPAVYAEYGFTFSACDNFNMAMTGNWYPYRVAGFEQHWSSMFYSMMFMNAVHLGKHIGIIDEKETFKSALRMFGLELLN